MSCITTVSFFVLVNGVACPFFHAETRLRQGCPLSPLLFLLVAEGLRIKVVRYLLYLIFMDDVLIFYTSMLRDINTLHDILDFFSKSTRMEINERKSTITTHMLSGEEN